MSPNTLLIFAKNPILGEVKTRLAASLGEQPALDIYLQLLEHTRRVAQEVGCKCELHYSKFVDGRDAWPGSHFQKKLQPEGDLGAKMKAAFREAFAATGPARKVAIIGSDCMELETWHIQTAFEQLNRFDFVVGPATDGGYYLLAMNRFQPELFDGMAWSGPDVFAQTLAVMARMGKSCYLLPMLRDVDYAEDWLAAPKKSWKKPNKNGKP